LFDIGNTFPEFKTLYMSPKEKRPQGFDMIVAFNYQTSPETAISLKIPITVPGYGELKVPICVTGPHIEGKLRLDCRIETCHYEYLDTDEEIKKGVTEPFLGLALGFDKIDTIHLNNIQVMNAPKFGWLQSFSTIKQKIHTVINGAISSDEVTVHLFDKKFGYIGAAQKKRYRGFDEEGLGYQLDKNGQYTCYDDQWNVQEIVNEIVICHKCKKKFLRSFPTCCCAEPPIDHIQAKMNEFNNLLSKTLKDTVVENLENRFFEKKNEVIENDVCYDPKEMRYINRNKTAQETRNIAIPTIKNEN